VTRVNNAVEGRFIVRIGTPIDSGQQTLGRQPLRLEGVKQCGKPRRCAPRKYDEYRDADSEAHRRADRAAGGQFPLVELPLVDRRTYERRWVNRKNLHLAPTSNENAERPRCVLALVNHARRQYQTRCRL
jgi:hypothetical protein